MKKVRAFEEYLNTQLDAKYGDFVQLFNKTLAMSDEVKAALDKLLTEVKSTFKV